MDRQCNEVVKRWTNLYQMFRVSAYDTTKRWKIQFTGHTKCQRFHGNGYFRKYSHYTFALFT